MPKLKDLTGSRFSELIVVDKAESSSKKTRWKCKCDCGNETIVHAQGLLRGTCKSCGDTRFHISGRGGAHHIKHGLVKTARYKMYMAAKQRAKEKNLPFTITLSEMPIIPERCPVFDFKLEKNPSHGLHDTSPSLDKIVPEKGYVPGNIQIISGKANKMKSNATTDEIGRLYRFMLEVEMRQEKEIIG